MRRVSLICSYLLLLFGSLFLVVDIAGLFHNENYSPTDHHKLTWPQVFELVDSLQKKSGEDVNVYYRRLVHDVNSSTEHYFVEGKQPWSVLQRNGMPFLENWAYYIRSYLRHEIGRWNYVEFNNPYFALRRGYGFCSQRALIAGSILERQGYHVEILGLSGHVVLDVPGKNLILDPDYNVVMPYSISMIEKDPGLVAKYYPDNAAAMVEIYGRKGNRSGGLPSRFGRAETRQYIYYLWASWLLPGVSLLAGAGLWVRLRRKRKVAQPAMA